MSQPEATPPADGASALLAAAAKTPGAGRRPRYTPKAKEPKPPVETGASSGEPVPAAQEPPAQPEPAPATKDADAAPSAAQQPTEPPKPAEEAPAPNSAPETPPSSSAETPPQPDPAEKEPPPPTGEVGFPAKPLSFESVFTRKRQPDMDPEMFAMVQQRQMKLLKSLANIVLMFQERREEYDRSVASAVAAGFPKEELAKLAIAHDCAPFLEAALGEHLPGTPQ